MGLGPQHSSRTAQDFRTNIVCAVQLGNGDTSVRCSLLSVHVVVKTYSIFIFIRSGAQELLSKVPAVPSALAVNSAVNVVNGRPDVRAVHNCLIRGHTWPGPTTAEGLHQRGGTKYIISIIIALQRKPIGVGKLSISSGTPKGAGGNTMVATWPRGMHHVYYSLWHAQP